MRRAIVFCMLSLLAIGVHGQNPLGQKFSIAFENETVVGALRELEIQSGCRFSFNPDALPKTHTTETFESVSLERILKNLLGANYDFKVRGSYVVIRPQEVKSNAQKSIAVSGQIADAQTGKKIENVSVYEVDNLTAALSQKDGTYELRTVSRYPYSLLAISKENYKDTIIAVSDLQKANFTIQLSPIPESGEDSSSNSKKDGIFKFIKSDPAKQHDKNVELQEERLMQFSLLPVLGTNGVLGGKVSNNFSLNLIAGYGHSLNGVEIGGVLNMERANMRGTQIAGVSNLIGERMTGVQIAGVSNTNLLNGKGVQISGVTNSSGVFEGTQIAGTYNYVKHTMRGFQASGTINYAGELNGVQLGVINIAKKVDKGVMIGLLNFAGNGLLRLEAEHNDLTQYNLTFKSGTKAFYSIFSSGISPQAPTQLWSYGLGFGSQLVTREKIYFGLEATSNTIQPLEKYIDGMTMDNRVKLLFGFNFLDHLSISAGPIAHYYLYARKATENFAFYESIGYKPLISWKWPKSLVGISRVGEVLRITFSIWFMFLYTQMNYAFEVSL